MFRAFSPSFAPSICSSGFSDTPQSVGLPPIEEWRNDYPAGGRKDTESRSWAPPICLQTISSRNGYLWLFAFANFFVYIARYSMLDWGPTYLKEVKHASLGEGGVSTAALEFSAIFSTILMGWLSDKLGGRRGMISVLCMVPVLLSYLGIIYGPANKLWISLGLFGSDWFLCLSHGIAAWSLARWISLRRKQ